MAVETRILVRQDSATNWSTVNPTLGIGEVGYVTSGSDTWGVAKTFKIGDGSSTWKTLTSYFSPILNGPAAEINSAQTFTGTQTFSAPSSGQSAAVFQHKTANSSAPITKWVGNDGVTTLASVSSSGSGAFSSLSAGTGFTVNNDGSVYAGSVDVSNGWASQMPSGSRLLVGSDAGAISGTTGVAGLEIVTSQGVSTTRYPVIFSTTTIGVAGYIKIVTNSANTAATMTLYNQTSDYRLKENVKPYTDGTSKILSLKPVTFNWVGGDSGEIVHGFIAHEFQDVIPEGVNGFKDEVDENGKPVHQVMDHTKVIPYLVSALQDALKRIEILEAK